MQRQEGVVLGADQDGAVGRSDKTCPDAGAFGEEYACSGVHHQVFRFELHTIQAVWEGA